MLDPRIRPALRGLGRSARDHSVPELITLTEAVVWLAVARFAVARVPFRTCIRLLRLEQGVDDGPVDGRARRRARTVRDRVHSASRQVPWDTACLARVLAGAAMLRVRRLPFTIYLGVAAGSRELSSSALPAASSDSPVLTAHAWLRCGHDVITGEEEMAAFSAVATYRTKT